MRRHRGCGSKTDSVTSVPDQPHHTPTHVRFSRISRVSVRVRFRLSSSYCMLLLCVLTDDHWEFVGHTIVTNNYVRLTADVRSSQGAIWNTAVSIFCTTCSKQGWQVSAISNLNCGLRYAWQIMLSWQWWYQCRSTGGKWSTFDIFKFFCW